MVEKLLDSYIRKGPLLRKPFTEKYHAYQTRVQVWVDGFAVGTIIGIDGVFIRLSRPTILRRYQVSRWVRN